MALSKRCLQEDPTCDFCGMSEESLTHMLFKCSHATEPSSTDCSSWERPIGAVIKINVDAGISKGSKYCGIGASSRDYAGKVVGISLRVFPSITCPRIVEAMALWEGLQMGLNLHFSFVIIESDVESIV